MKNCSKITGHRVSYVFFIVCVDCDQFVSLFATFFFSTTKSIIRSILIRQQSNENYISLIYMALLNWRMIFKFKPKWLIIV